jgi:GH18 family chitinase
MPVSGLLPILCLLLGPTAVDERAEAGSDFRIVGYLPDYRAASYDLAQARGLTDLIVFSSEPTADGGLNADRLKKIPWAKLRDFKTRNRVRLILCVGGWGRSAHFATAASSDESRRKFAQSAVRFCLDERLDGIDLDWEHPKNDDEQANYAAILKACRDGFRPHGLTLSVTVAAWQKLPRAAFESVDAVNVMSYDNQGRHSTFDAAQADVKTLIDRGSPKEKIVLGLPFYGRHVTRRNEVLTYRQIVAKYDPGAETDEADSIYFNGPATVRRKTDYALESGLGGVMVWELGQDADGKRSLLKVIEAAVQKRRK